jgi:transcriptional regulator with XRE-family HTH domain
MQRPLNGPKIRARLGEIGLSHRELAERLGVTRARVSQMCESGVADPDLADRVALALGLPAGALDDVRPDGSTIVVTFTGLPSRWPDDARAAQRLAGRCLARANQVLRSLVRPGREPPASVTVSAAAGSWDPNKPDRVGP